MNSMERARVFIARGKRLAATVVPIAAMAVAASTLSAGTLVVDTIPTLEGRSGGTFVLNCSGCGFQTSQLSPLNGLSGVKIYGDASGILTSPGNGIMVATSGGFADLTGPLPASIPYLWDFTIQIDRPVDGDPPVIPFSYNPRLAMNGSAIYNNIWFNLNLVSGVATRITGSSALAGADGLSEPSSWQFALILSWEGMEGDQFSLTIPNSSIDINATAAVGSAVPEPSALLLAAGGLGLVLLRRTRRAKR